mmetsp:Transcript_4422/g.8915  ORF Transcript_4422/g.8915 Transcript_4422/m.8915 type:complete len:272 (+) Transcript_4422:70-885(+)
MTTSSPPSLLPSPHLLLILSCADEVEEVDPTDDSADDGLALDALSSVRPGGVEPLLSGDEGEGLVVKDSCEHAEVVTHGHLLEGLVQHLADGIPGVGPSAKKLRGHVAFRDDTDDVAGGVYDRYHVETLVLKEPDCPTDGKAIGDGEWRLGVKVRYPLHGPPLLELLVLDDLVVSEPVVYHPVVRECLGHVVADAIGENDNALLTGFEALGVLESLAHGCPTAPPTKKSLLPDHLPHGDKALLIVALGPDVNELSIKNVGDEVITDTFNSV